MQQCGVEDKWDMYKPASLRRLDVLWAVQSSLALVNPFISRALETPVVGLFGYTNPKRSGPYRLYQDLVVDGYADHSYGIHVAQMAGLPRDVTDRASEILRNLESSDLDIHKNLPDEAGSAASQIGLFEVRDDRLREKIRTLDLQTMTPLQAMQILDELKRAIDAGGTEDA